MKNGEQIDDDFFISHSTRRALIEKLIEEIEFFEEKIETLIKEGEMIEGHID